MENALNTFVDFHADFPKPQSWDDDVGRDLAEFVAAGLRERGIDVRSVEDDETAYRVLCASGESDYEIHASVDLIGEADRWNLIVVPRSGFRWPWQKQRLEVEPFTRLLLAVDDVLKQSHRIWDIRWFQCYDMPTELARQVAYGGPLQDQVLDRPVLTWLDRLEGTAWAVSSYVFPRSFVAVLIGVLVFVIGGVFRVNALSGLGFSMAVLSGTLGFFTPCSALALSLWNSGWRLFQSRRREGSLWAYPGLAIAIVGGGILMFLGISGLSGSVTAVLRWMQQ